MKEDVYTNPYLRVRISPFLEEAIQVVQVKRRYRSPSEYIKALIRADIAKLNEPHPEEVILWACLNPGKQDKVDQELARNVGAIA